MLLKLFKYKLEGLMNDNFLIGKKLPNFNLKTSKRDTLTALDLMGNRNIIFIYPKLLLKTTIALLICSCHISGVKKK